VKPNLVLPDSRVSAHLMAVGPEDPADPADLVVTPAAADTTALPEAAPLLAVFLGLAVARSTYLM
jgi:hypothetical protein